MAAYTANYTDDEWHRVVGLPVVVRNYGKGVPLSPHSLPTPKRRKNKIKKGLKTDQKSGGV